MKAFPARLAKKLEDRKANGSLRSLGPGSGLTDFASNDYLGFASDQGLMAEALKLLIKQPLINGATGSRLVSGNHELYAPAEDFLRDFHRTEAALIFNSGYDANLGFFASVPGRGDLVFYDEFIHASIRDGIVLGHATGYKFRHNDLEDLQQQLQRHRGKASEKEAYIVTESVFSMDGDSPDLKAIASLAENHACRLVIDEAHALGVFGKQGAGLVQELELQDRVFARIVTFGKALGTHGAAILGSRDQKDYLVNFSRSLIYTTALPPFTVATIHTAYAQLAGYRPRLSTSPLNRLQANINFFREEIEKRGLTDFFLESESAIHSLVLPGNERVKLLAEQLEASGFEVKPILSPTVPEGRERLRLCLHSFNTPQEMSRLLEVLTTTLK